MNGRGLLTKMSRDTKVQNSFRDAGDGERAFPEVTDSVASKELQITGLSFAALIMKRASFSLQSSPPLLLKRESSYCTLIL